MRRLQAAKSGTSIKSLQGPLPSLGSVHKRYRVF